MTPIRLIDLLHPCRAYDLLEWYWRHKQGTWEQLFETNRKRALELEWRKFTGKKIDWDNPKTLNEKIQWLMAFTDTSLWTKYSDKYEVRRYVEECGYKECLTELLGLWDRVDDINFDALPDTFVLKCTHDAGSTILVDKAMDFDKDAVAAFLRWRMKMTYGYKFGEPYYAKIRPRIIAERLLPQSRSDGTSGQESGLVDYKFLCIEGKVQFVLLCYNRNLARHTHVSDIYTIDPWESRKDFLSKDYLNQEFKPIPRPENLERMVEMAERLSRGFHELRVDLYNIDGKIYFGEMTFAWMSGKIRCLSDEMQLKMGQKIILLKRKG